MTIMGEFEKLNTVSIINVSTVFNVNYLTPIHLKWTLSSLVYVSENSQLHQGDFPENSDMYDVTLNDTAEPEKANASVEAAFSR